MGKKKGKHKKTPRYQEESNDSNPLVTRLSFELDEHQDNYVKTIQSAKVVFVDAMSGTGKTTLAVHQGLEFLRKSLSQTLTYIRFPDDRYLGQGFLPGTLEEKEQELFHPFFDALTELGVSTEQLKFLREEERIMLATDATMRGRNLKNMFVIIDEAQNARNVSDLQLLLTRIHDRGGRAVVIGHSGQQDNRGVELTKRLKLTPFEAYRVHMLKKPFTRECKLEINYRGDISQWADKIQETLNEL